MSPSIDSEKFNKTLRTDDEFVEYISKNWFPGSTPADLEKALKSSKLLVLLSPETCLFHETLFQSPSKNSPHNAVACLCNGSFCNAHLKKKDKIIVQIRPSHFTCQIWSTATPPQRPRS